MKVYVVRQDREDDVMPYDVATETSIGDLKLIIAAETDVGADTFTLTHNNSPLLDDSKTLGALSISDGDLLSLAARQAQPRPAPPQAQQGQIRSGESPSDAQVEQFRQELLSSPQMQEEYRRRVPQLVSSAQNAQSFRDTFHALERQRQAAVAERYTQMENLNNDVNEENQAKILEMIRQEQIDKEMEATMQTNPELFGRVTMLYVDIEVNGVPVKAFVDSGAQATIMSPDCAERCNVTRLIDRRWQGMARGVGTAKILGRVHRANVKIADDEVPCAFTVMEGKDVDMLLGLDMLKRYQACIDLSQNRLVFPGGQSVPFLPESEIPKTFEEASQQEPTVAGPGGTVIGAETGAIKPAASKVGAATSGFQGQGRTLGAGPSAAAGTSSASAPAPAASSAPAQAPSASSTQFTAPPGPPPGRTEASSEFPQRDVDALVGMGLGREEAIQLLRMTGGNVDMAAAHAFDM